MQYESNIYIYWCVCVCVYVFGSKGVREFRVYKRRGGWVSDINIKM